MQAPVAEATRRIPAKAATSGRVISWSAQQGQRVTTGDELGTFADEYGELLITAPCSGVVGKFVAPGAKVEGGQPLVYITATSPQDEPPHPPQQPPAPQPAKNPGTIQKPLEGPPPERKAPKRPSDPRRTRPAWRSERGISAGRRV